MQDIKCQMSLDLLKTFLLIFNDVFEFLTTVPPVFNAVNDLWQFVNWFFEDFSTDPQWCQCTLTAASFWQSPHPTLSPAIQDSFSWSTQAPTVKRVHCKNQATEQYSSPLSAAFQVALGCCYCLAPVLALVPQLCHTALQGSSPPATAVVFMNQ